MDSFFRLLFQCSYAYFIGSSMMRFEIASGKAYGALAVGLGSRWLNAQAATRPHFLGKYHFFF